MEVNKSKLLKVFNTHFFEFIDDIIKIFPENLDVKSSRILFELTKKANPSLLVKLWHQFVHIPYNEVLCAGNLEYFINKDYSNDVGNLSNSSDVLVAIEKLRNPIKEMSDENRKHSLEYLNNLNKLSDAYVKLNNTT
jgi:hypothetical protein